LRPPIAPGMEIGCMVRDSAEYEVDPDGEASEFNPGYCRRRWRGLPSWSRMPNNMSSYGQKIGWSLTMRLLMRLKGKFGDPYE
jgi:hypothetical protein